jgi:hypothetical protein
MITSRLLSEPLSIRRPSQVRDREKRDKKDWHECFRAISGQIMRDEGRDPSEGEASIGPLFESGEARDKKRDSAHQFGDAQNDSQLLRIADVGKPLDCLRTTGQIGECSEQRQQGDKAGCCPVNYFASHAVVFSSVK